ncbi:MAG: hypothetical protein HY929_03455 [Euryarchaeota archaeon]|nr:hypothetical protein [Euryarchaeota archaeon]
MLYEILLMSASFGIAFLSALFLTRLLISALSEAGFVSQDTNKIGYTRIPESGGIAIVLGVSSGLLFAVSLYDEFRLTLTAVLATVLFLGFIGLLDDFIGLSQAKKIILVAFTGLPLVAAHAGGMVTEIQSLLLNIPTIKLISEALVFILAGVSCFYFIKKRPVLGIIFALLSASTIAFTSYISLYWVLIPIGVTAAANATNMLAGFNGLESGLGAICAFFVMVDAIILARYDAAIVSAALFGTCLAFLKYNNFPAKVFPGDVGTLAIGGTIAAASVIGHFEIVAMIAIAPALFEFILKVSVGFRKDPSIRTVPKLEGSRVVLIPPKGMPSISHIILNRRKMTEPELVKNIWLLGIISGIFSIVYLLLRY